MTARGPGARPEPGPDAGDGPGRAGRQAAPGTHQQDSAGVISDLYAEHALGLIRLAHIMLGSASAAEDVVQEAFCGLHRRWAHLTDQSKALGYLRSSVLNGCRSVLRRRATVELDDSHQAPTGSAEAALLTAEERRAVVRALRGLPHRQREVLTLRFYLDLPDDQIAATMGIRPGSVRSAAHRGLISLRSALQETP